MRRDIPKLQTLCFRSMGGHGCNAEDTFAPIPDTTATPTDEKGATVKKLNETTTEKDSSNSNKEKTKLSTASRLLRSFGAPLSTSSSLSSHEDENNDDNINRNIETIQRSPVIGVRRKQANDVDLNHPWIAVLDEEEQEHDDAKPTTSASGIVDADGDMNMDSDSGGDLNEENNEKEESLIQEVTTTTPGSEATLVMEYGSPSLDLLQQFIDSLVELGRMDDNRLGLHFFQEWKANVLLKQPNSHQESTAATTTPQHNLEEESSSPPPKKRRVGRPSKSKSPVPKSSTPTSQRAIVPLGSLSLHNATIHLETISAMIDSQMTYHLGVLDLTGIATITDELLETLLKKSPNIQRLSLKNCRRITNKSLLAIQDNLSTSLQALDIGGSYNLQPTRVIELVCHLMNLTELHASGLLWTGETIKELTSLKATWKALSLGFLVSTRTPYFHPGTDEEPAAINNGPGGLGSAVITGGWKDSLQWSMLSSTLQSLAIPFCDSNSMFMVDAALMGLLGRHLPMLRVLDVRGNNTLQSLTGWYDGRATITPKVGPQPLTVLARYSGISKSSVEDTKRIHPLAAMDLNCILDSEGIGAGILRKTKKEK